MTQYSSILLPVTIYSTDDNTTNPSNLYPGHCYYYDNLPTDHIDRWGDEVAVSGDIIRLKYLTQVSSQWLNRYRYFKLQDYTLTWATPDEIEAAQFTILTKAPDTDVFASGVDDVQYSSSDGIKSYDWWFGNTPYRVNLYSSGLIVAAIIDDIAIIISNTADSTSNKLTVLSPLGSCAFYRALPGYEDMDRPSHQVGYKDWYDREVLFVDGIKWEPEREREGQFHEGGNDSPCGSVVVTDEFVGYICDEIDDGRFARYRQYRLILNGEETDEYVKGTIAQKGDWFDQEDCESGSAPLKWIEDPEGGTICENDVVYGRLVRLDHDGEVGQPPVYRPDYSKVVISQCPDCIMEKNKGITISGKNFFEGQYSYTIYSHDCGHTWEPGDEINTSNLTYPYVGKNVLTAGDVYKTLTAQRKAPSAMTVSHPLYIDGLFTVKGVVADAVYVGEYSGAGIYSGFMLADDDRLFYYCLQICQNSYYWGFELPFNEEVRDLITSPMVLNFKQHYIGTYPCDEFRIFGMTDTGYALFSCPFVEPRSWTKTAITPSMPIQGELWATLMEGDSLYILTSEYLYRLNMEGQVTMVAANTLDRQGNHPILYNDKSMILYSAYSNLGMNLNGDDTAIYNPFKEVGMETDPVCPQTYGHLVSNEGCPLTFWRETENHNGGVPVKSTYADYFGYVWLGEYYTSNPDYTAKFAIPFVAIKSATAGAHPSIYIDYYNTSSYVKSYPIGYTGAYALYRGDDTQYNNRTVIYMLIPSNN